MTRRSKRLLVFCAVTSLLLGSSCVLLLPGSPINQTSYEQVQIGMSVSELERILGRWDKKYPADFAQEWEREWLSGVQSEMAWLIAGAEVLHWGLPPEFQIEVQIDPKTQRVIAHQCRAGTIVQKVKARLQRLTAFLP